MAYDIGPKIGIKGESEFNQQIKSINNSLKEYQSELKVLSAEFNENADSQEALTRTSANLQKQMELQEQKAQALQQQYSKETDSLKTLATALEQAKNEFGANSKEAGKAESAFNKQAETVSKLKVAMNETEATIGGLNNKLKSNADKLDEIEDGARDAASGLKSMGDAGSEAGNDLNQMGQGVKGIAFAEIAEGLSSMKDAVVGVVEESKEYIKIMGALEQSSQRLGYSNAQTKETYNQLYAILGDDQTAATATANLQALGLSQSDLTSLVNETIGAWAQYGDSVPIDSLAEAINETAKVGQVTGVFADVLNWAGTSEDEFNEKLANASTESERANLIMQELANQGLAQSAEGFRTQNSELVAANTAEAEYKDAMASLAQVVMPMVSTATSALATVISFLTGIFEQLPTPVQEIIKYVGIALGIFATVAPIVLTIAAAIAVLQATAAPIIAIILAIIAVVTAIIAIITNWGSIVNWFKGVWQKAMEKVKSIWKTIKAIFNAIPAWWSSLWSRVGNYVSQVWNNIVNGISSRANRIWSTIVGAFNSVISFITSLPSRAWHWGVDFINGLANGIMNTVNRIVNAVKNVANKIKSFLHFSRPDVGPLREYEQWMPDFMQGLAKGIDKNIGVVQKAVTTVSGTISGEMQDGLSSQISGVQSVRSKTIYIDGDTMTLDGKVIGQTARREISLNEISRMKAKGAR